MSNLMKKTKKELVEIILRKDDKEQELNQNIDSKQIVINSLEDELKVEKEKVISCKQEIKELNSKHDSKQATINSLDVRIDNYKNQLLEADEAINNCKQIVTDTKSHLKQVNTNNKILSIVNFLLIIALAVAIFVR